MSRGFGLMDPEKQRKLAAEGGRNVPAEKRSFSQNRELASESGRKGGKEVKPEDRSFSKNRALAAEAGRKGGRMVHKKKRQAEERRLKSLEQDDGHRVDLEQVLYNQGKLKIDE